MNPGPPKIRVVGGMVLVRGTWPGQPGDVSMLTVIKPKKKTKEQRCHSVKKQV